MSEIADAMKKAMKKHMESSSEPPEKLSPEEIVSIVREMQSSPGPAKSVAAKYADKYPAFVEQCPTLFQKACKPGLDMNMLTFMVQSMAADDGDEQVGQHLANKFVAGNT